MNVIILKYDSYYQQKIQVFGYFYVELKSMTGQRF